MAVVAAYTAIMTFLILKGMQRFLGPLRPTDYEEDVGLDWTDHGEVLFISESS